MLAGNLHEPPAHRRDHDFLAAHQYPTKVLFRRQSVEGTVDSRTI